MSVTDLEAAGWREVVIADSDPPLLDDSLLSMLDRSNAAWLTRVEYARHEDGRIVQRRLLRRQGNYVTIGGNAVDKSTYLLTTTSVVEVDEGGFPQTVAAGVLAFMLNGGAPSSSVQFTPPTLSMRLQLTALGVWRIVRDPSHVEFASSTQDVAATRAMWRRARARAVVELLLTVGLAWLAFVAIEGGRSLAGVLEIGLAIFTAYRAASSWLVRAVVRVEPDGRVELWPRGSGSLVGLSRRSVAVVSVEGVPRVACFVFHKHPGPELGYGASDNDGS